MSTEPKNNQSTSKPIGQPRHEPDTNALPSAVTFYMSTQERRALLGVLKPLATNRSDAILIALGLQRHE